MAMNGIARHPTWKTSQARRWLGLAAIMCALTAVAAPPLAAREAAGAQAKAGNLLVTQIWTTDPKGLQSRLDQAARPLLSASATAARNEPISLLIFYANCQRDPDGKCWLTARASITAPDGTPYGEPVGFDVLPMGPGAPAGRLALAPGSMALVVENGEQLGRYRVQLAVTDEIAVQTATSVVHLDIVEADTAAK